MDVLFEKVHVSFSSSAQGSCGNGARAHVIALRNIEAGEELCFS